MARKAAGAGRGLATVGNRSRNGDTGDSSGITEHGSMVTALHDPGADPGEEDRTSIPLESLAAHPHNLRDELGDLSELVASIRSAGLLQAVTVATRAAVVSADPSVEAELPDGAQWVILMGHRRAAAGKLAGFTEIDAVVRNDLAESSTTIANFLIENIQRGDLSPLDEARGYDRLANDGLSQRRIADRIGVSQGQVSKRLKLLELPTEVQHAITTGEVAVIDAMQLLELPTERRGPTFAARAAHGGDLTAAVRAEQTSLERARQAADIRQQLHADGIPEIDPQVEFGADHRAHRIPHDQVDAERVAGVVVGAAVEPDGAVYYRSATTAATEEDPPADGPARERDVAPAGLDEIGENDDPAGVGRIPHPNRRSGQEPTGGGTGAVVEPSAGNAAAPAEPSGTNSGVDTGGPTTKGRDSLPQAEAHRVAHAERRDACRRLLQSTIKPATIVEVLADAVLAGELQAAVSTHGGDVQQWTGQQVDDEDDVDLLLAGENKGAAQHTAFAVALAAIEHEAGQAFYAHPDEAWPLLVTRHVRRLAALGVHQVSEYEETKLATSDEFYTARRADSTGITP